MKKGNIFIVTGLLLIAAALILTGYNLLDSHRAGKAANEVLNQLAPMIKVNPVSPQGQLIAEHAGTVDQEYPTEEIEYPDYILNPKMDMPVQSIDNADYIGVISIPAINRELPVFSQWNYKNLKTAPCRYKGTAYLDNMVICAHNYRVHFGSLRNLSYGDTITFTDMDGNVFNYKVIEIETLQPTATEEMTTGDWDLTLFTCTIGGATRVTVRCEKVGI